MDDSTMQERYRALLLAARNLFSLTTRDDLHKIASFREGGLAGA
jgi:hypothetical protein